MVLPATVVTGRLELPLWDAETVVAIRTGQRRVGWHPGFPREDDRDAAGFWRPGDVWGPRSIVDAGVVVGSIGFFGPPQDAGDGTPEVEVGYGLVADARGRGLASEALAAMLGLTDEAGIRVRACVAPDNTASLRVTAKAGFTEIRETTEDGALVMVRPLRSPK